MPAAGRLGPDTHVRIARPSQDLAAAERFWVGGLGLEVLWRVDDEQDRLLMVGWPGAAWHLELVEDAALLAAHPPSPEDLLVLYVGKPVDDQLVDRLFDVGGARVTARNPYWETWGITVQDPDGYLLVLSHRAWPG